MLTSLLGVRMILPIGSTVPLPVLAAVMNALKQVRVVNDADGQDGFQITFTLGKDRLGDYRLLASGALDPDKPW